MGNPSRIAPVYPQLVARAVVIERPQELALRDLELDRPRSGEAVVDVEWSGISTGTEKLLWSGRMPDFPGMGYPLVPGYESVGRIAACGPASRFDVGDRVFVSGARCFGRVQGLFGGAASRLVVDEKKLTGVDEALEDEAVLLALAATAHHALYRDGNPALPDLIVGHGVLGRLLARLSVALGKKQLLVRETNAARQAGAVGYDVVDPATDDGQYARILDASGDAAIIDSLIQNLRPQGEIVLAGFYAERVSFSFPPAFMREASIRIAAEWKPADLEAVTRLIASGELSLAGLISHRAPADTAAYAYPTAFDDPHCLKMVLDWRKA